MKKIKTNYGYKFIAEKRDYWKMAVVSFFMVLVGFGFTFTVLSAIQPKQMIYDGKVEKYNSVLSDFVSARVEMLEAKKELAKEKMELAMNENNWEEIERLKNIMIEIEHQIENPLILNPEEKVFQFPPQ